LIKEGKTNANYNREKIDSFNSKKKFLGLRLSSVVRCLLSNYEALALIPSNLSIKKHERKRKKNSAHAKT
jgi:hypothetical protein